MEYAQTLVRSVVRIFYSLEEIVLIDALVTHSAFDVPDAAVIIGTPNAQKAAQRHLGRLKEAGLVAVFSRPEIREGALKPIMKEYYFIDYRRAIDATKYRIHMIDKKIKAAGKPNQEKKELRCPQCKSEWTTLDVLDNIDPRAAASGRGSGFLCKRCNHPLDSITQNGEPEKDDLPARFNKQFGPLLAILQQIDNSFIFAVTGEMALASALPVPRGKGQDKPKTEPVRQQIITPSTVKGIASGPEKIEIVITTDADNNAAAQKAERERQARIAQQNALPEWHTHSTVTNERTALGILDAQRKEGEADASFVISDTPGEEEDKKTVDTSMDAYFAALAAEQEERRRRAAAGEDDEDEEDEEDMDFEDTLITVPETTNGEPEAKRVKVDEREPTQPPPVPAAAVASAPASTESAAGEESDEDEEFEDAI